MGGQVLFFLLSGTRIRYLLAQLLQEPTIMINRIKNHPYTVTSIVFLGLIIVGAILLDWREDHYAYLLLLYFIITIGIRLDEVVNRLNQLTGSQLQPRSRGDDDAEAAQQARIQALLENIHQELCHIRTKIDRKQP